MTDLDFVILEQYCDPYYANIIRGLLETNGLDCLLFDDGHAQNAWYLQSMLGVRIMVRKGDFDAARALIAAIEENPLPLPEDEEPPAGPAVETTLTEKILAAFFTLLTGVFFFFPGKRKKRRP